MNDTIIVATLSLVGTFTGVFFSSRRTTALLSYRMEKLEKKVDKHNNLVERMYRVEGRQDVHEKELKVANHRIEDLEDITRKGA